jgi:hypothetical protein
MILWVLAVCFCLLLLVVLFNRRAHRKAARRQESIIELANRVYDKHVPGKDVDPR